MGNKGLAAGGGEPFCGHSCPCHVGTEGRGLGPFPLSTCPAPHLWPRAVELTEQVRPRDPGTRACSPWAPRPPPQQTVENGVGAGGYGVGQEAGLAPLVLGAAGPQPHGALQTLRSLSHGVGSQGRW